MSTSTCTRSLQICNVDATKGYSSLEQVVNGMTLSGPDVRSSNTRNSDQHANFSTIYLIEIAIDTDPGDLHAISLELCHKLLYLYLLLWWCIQDILGVRSKSPHKSAMMHKHVCKLAVVRFVMVDPVLPFLQAAAATCSKLCHIFLRLFITMKDFFDMSACVVDPDTEETGRQWDDHLIIQDRRSQNRVHCAVITREPRPGLLERSNTSKTPRDDLGFQPATTLLHVDAVVIFSLWRSSDFAMRSVKRLRGRSIARCCCDILRESWLLEWTHSAFESPSTMPWATEKWIQRFYS